MHGLATALVSTVRWRTESGAPRTTIVGKLALQFDSTGALVGCAPAPLVPWDAAMADPAYVSAVSELAPFSAVASVVPLNGPLRIAMGSGAAARTIVVAAHGAAGYSMASAGRAPYAPRKPTRAADGVTVIPTEVDGRYFCAAPESWQLGALRGDELIELEAPGMRGSGRLPSTCVVVTVQLGPRQRTLALVADLLVVDGASRTVAIVSRAVVAAEATVVSHVVMPAAHAPTDRGDAPFAKSAGADIVDEPSEAFTIPVPATPFDPGFAPAAVTPGVGVAETLMPVDSLAAQLDALRAQLRASHDDPDADPNGPPKPR